MIQIQSGVVIVLLYRPSAHSVCARITPVVKKKKKGQRAWKCFYHLSQSRTLRSKTASEDNLINSVIGYGRADLKREDKKFGRRLLIVVLLVGLKQNSRSSCL